MDDDNLSRSSSRIGLPFSSSDDEDESEDENSQYDDDQSDESVESDEKSDDSDSSYSDEEESSDSDRDFYLATSEEDDRDEFSGREPRENFRFQRRRTGDDYLSYIPDQSEGYILQQHKIYKEVIDRDSEIQNQRDTKICHRVKREVDREIHMMIKEDQKAEKELQKQIKKSSRELKKNLHRETAMRTHAEEEAFQIANQLRMANLAEEARQIEQERQRRERERIEEARRREEERRRAEEHRIREEQLRQAERQRQAEIQRQAERQKPKQHSQQAEKEPQHHSSSSTTATAAPTGPWNGISQLFVPQYEQIVDLQKRLDTLLEMHNNAPEASKKEHEKWMKSLTQQINIPLNQLCATRKDVRNKEEKIQQIFETMEGKDDKPILIRKIFADTVIKHVDRKSLYDMEIKSVFPLALLARKITRDDPMACQIMLAELARVCPYVIPIYLKGLKEEGRREYKGAYEADLPFYNRIEGYIVFFAAMCQYPFAPDANKMDYFNLSSLWCWFARLLNTRPAPITPVLLRGGLKPAMYQLAHSFRGEFVKILDYIQKEFIPILERDAPNVPVIGNISSILDLAIKEGIAAPVGLEIREDIIT